MEEKGEAEERTYHVVFVLLVLILVLVRLLRLLFFFIAISSRLPPATLKRLRRRSRLARRAVLLNRFRVVQKRLALAVDLARLGVPRSVLLSKVGSGLMTDLGVDENDLVLLLLKLEEDGQRLA